MWVEFEDKGHRGMYWEEANMAWEGMYMGSGRDWGVAVVLVIVLVE